MADGSYPVDEGYSVERLRRQYNDFASDKNEELKEQRQARHYYHGDHYTAEQIKELKARRQPIVTTPRLTKKINGIVGLLERMRQDPKAYPRTPQQEAGAELGTAIIRYALDQAEWTAISPEVCLNAAVNGIGGVELFTTQGDMGDPEVGLSTVDPETFFYDQRSIRFDFSDARFMGIAKWVDLEVAQEMFPDKSEELASLVSSGTSGGQDLAVSEQTQDRETRWVNTNEKQLFLVEHWYLKGGAWHWCFYSFNVELKKGVSAWKDEKGKSLCRFLMFSVNVDHDGDRYGFIRHLKSPTDETNARRSKALHVMHSRRIIAEKGAVENIDKARREASRPDGYIEKVPGLEFEFDDVSKANDWTAQINLLEESKNELENFGPNPALLGELNDKNHSGRAISLLQQAGIAELGPFIIAYRNWKLRVYRAIWNVVQQTWTAERYIRVTDENDIAQFIQLNGLKIDPATGHPTIVNALGSLDVDIILDEGPDTMNVMQDTYDTLSALAQNGAQVPPDVLIELSSLPQSTKKKVLDRLQQASQPNPLMVREAEAKIAGEEAKVEETRSKTLKNVTDAHLMVADAMRPEPMEAAPAPEPPKPPAKSINFKDVPPEAQSQMLAQAGIYIPPHVIAAYQEQEAQRQAALKAQSRPQAA
jgi:hypothetical protein